MVLVSLGQRFVGSSRFSIGLDCVQLGIRQLNIPDLRVCSRLVRVNLFIFLVGMVEPVFARVRKSLILIDDSSPDFSLNIELMPLEQLHSQFLSVDFQPCPSHLIDFLFLHDLIQNVLACSMVFLKNFLVDQPLGIFGRDSINS